MINFMPVLVMNGILFVITILLVIADRLLITYGKCRVTVRQDDKVDEFVVDGGNTLLNALIENHVEISSSCGGKGSCGYCKIRVTKGGGQILPTEEIFMSTREKRENMRLACQVKVKEDMEAAIPDFLSVVREIVVQKKFDPKKRWKVTIR
ncbi:MAG: 2Fe-2S iron-sulfur cluster binding domain-containing protein [Spirochaetales bacterium]|nr:2Fe-2S iron-sulfur cluster binding domain-containing protein [Spirochaetales bacterium]